MGRRLFITGVLLLIVIVGVIVASNALPAAAPVLPDGIAATNVWMRAANEGARGAVYMTLTNGGAADSLIGGETDAARRVEIHNTTVDERGVAMMREIEALDLPAGETVRIEPAGVHIMLVRLSQNFVEGDRFPLTLEFADADSLTIEVEVRAASAN